MRNLRSIYNKAVADKQFVKREDLFQNVHTGVTQTMKRALSLNELKKLLEFDISSLLKRENQDSRRYAINRNIKKASHYFFFSFYARGMSFIDLAYLRKDNIRSGFIRYVRKKTGRQIEVRITTEMQEIINSFAFEVKDSPYVFPIIRESTKHIRLQYETALKAQNIHLKKLAGLSGVNKAISTHWARHSWATIGKQENVPLRVISECLGHTSEKTTLIYLGLLDNSLLDAANQVVASAILRPHLLSYQSR